MTREKRAKRNGVVRAMARSFHWRWPSTQAGFNRDTAREQFRRLKARFPTEFYFHLEFMRWGGGPVVPGCIPLVRFSDEQRLQEIIDTCREIGVMISYPHVCTVEDGGRCVGDPVQIAAKHRYDPPGLFNPGKLRAFDEEA